MPCSARKARVLLKNGDATVVKRTPFTIRLTKASGETVQPVSLGVDSGYAHIGLSATTLKREVFSAEVLLRTDIVDLNSERRAYRRARRNRKTWYRQPRFINRKKADSWLAPSIQHKVDSHLKIINRVPSILPITNIIVEVAAFDIQKIKNPLIEGTGYQEGEQKDFWNIREYVLFRDGHKCQHCKGKSKDPILNVHHIVSRKTGGDRPDNLITLCETCHSKHHCGDIHLKVKPSNGFKAETFMSMVRWRIVNTLKSMYPDVQHTYGHITKSNRIAGKIPKSHVNDAFVISGECCSTIRSSEYLIKQVRKCNRKLFKGIRSHLKNTAPRFIHGFQRYDKVLWNKQECFIFGRRSSGYFDLRSASGTKINASVNFKQLVLKESSRTFLIERKSNSSST
jgi:hypothetical protein